MSGSVKVVSNGPIGGVLRFDLPGIGVAGVGASLPRKGRPLPGPPPSGWNQPPRPPSATWERKRWW